MFQVGYCGYYTRNSDYDVIYRPNGSNDYLFLLILSPMIFHLGREEILAKSGACILYSKDSYQHYNSVKEFSNSFVHFSGDDADILRYPIPLNQLFYPKNLGDIHSILKVLRTEFLLKSPYYEEKISSLVHQLLIELSRSFLQEENVASFDVDIYNQFSNLRLQMFTHCEEEWNAERMCKTVNLEKSQFYTYYKTFFHESPKTGLLIARIDKARYLLNNESIQVKQAASLCGFTNIYHFTRYFKQICGCTPSEYRKNL